MASAQIKDGKLAFANLYMGRYYLVERATGLVLPIDGNGKLYVTGKYPQLIFCKLAVAARRSASGQG